MSGYLFYSDHCETCKSLRTYMNNHKLINIFNCKNVDNMNIEELQSLGLQHVPTILIIHTMPNGGVKQGLYEGKDACIWIENMVMSRKKNLMMQTENTRKLIELNNMKKNIKDGILDNCVMENNGISDEYAFFSNDINLDMKLDMSQPKSFLPYGKDNEYRILTIPQDSTQKGYKLKTNDQLKLAADLNAIRNQQDEKIKQIMHQDQINSIVVGQNKNFT